MEDLPHPNIVFREAQCETPKRYLEPYRETIEVLRTQKNFTASEIAEWLTNQSVGCETEQIEEFIAANDATE